MSFIPIAAIMKDAGISKHITILQKKIGYGYCVEPGQIQKIGYGFAHVNILTH